MDAPTPYFRQAGSGEGVVCLHANASTSSQWSALLQRLSSRFSVYAPDLLGAGRSPAPPQDRPVTLSDEVSLIEPVLALAGRPLSLVGHSYGAAVALVAALRHVGDVRSLAVYEPTLFSLLEQESPGSAAAAGIRDAATDAAAAIDRGEPGTAAERFLDYWMGAGTWSAMPEQRRPAIARSMAGVRGWASALFDEPTPQADFGELRVPVLLMIGGRSPNSSLGVARLLASALPDVTVMEFPELGHMGPVTHPDVVGEAVEGFLERRSV